MFLRLVIGLAVVSLSLAPRISYAQVSVDSDLTFNTMFAGTMQHIPPTSPLAASFSHGVLALNFTMKLTLPAELKREGTGESMPISFGPADGWYETRTLGILGSEMLFNPHEIIGLRLSLLAVVRIRVGGTINPPANQRPGTYTGTIVLTVTNL